MARKAQSRFVLRDKGSLSASRRCPANDGPAGISERRTSMIDGSAHLASIVEPVDANAVAHAA